MSDDWIFRAIKAGQKQGPGRGNWGHAGRPGEVGGSASSTGSGGSSPARSIEEYCKEIGAAPIEHAIITRDGKEIDRVDGDRGGVKFEVEQAKSYKDATLLHNHPVHQPPSLADVEFAVDNNLAEMQATYNLNDYAGWLYVLKRPATGWPPTYKVMDAIFKSQEATHASILKDIKKGNLSEMDEDVEHWHRTYTKMGKELGIGYDRQAVWYPQP